MQLIGRENPVTNLLTSFGCGYTQTKPSKGRKKKGGCVGVALAVNVEAVEGGNN